MNEDAVLLKLVDIAGGSAALVLLHFARREIGRGLAMLHERQRAEARRIARLERIASALCARLRVAPEAMPADDDDSTPPGANPAA